MTKVDRRILKSQEAIKNAILELMAEKNFDDITIRDISDKANVNRGTIYLHYMDKYDLLDKIIEEHISNLRELCHSASEMTFKEGNYVWFEYFADNHLFFSTMLNTKSTAYFRSRFLDLVVEEYFRSTLSFLFNLKNLHKKTSRSKIEVYWFFRLISSIIIWQPFC